MPALPYSITISDEERTYLKSLVKTRTIIRNNPRAKVRTPANVKMPLKAQHTKIM